MPDHPVHSAIEQPETIDLRRAYRAGKRSALTGVDADEAAARWSRRNCPTHPPQVVCPLEHAWYDGFEFDCHDQQPDYLAKGARS